MKKRGQITQEAMTIYGYVLISIILALVAIVFFDVGKFSFMKRTGTCAFSSQIECEDFIYNRSAQNFTISIRNRMDFAVHNVTLEASGPCTGATWREAEDAILGVDAREAVLYDLPCALETGTHIVDITMNFTTIQNIDIIRHKQGYIRVSLE